MKKILFMILITVYGSMTFARDTYVNGYSKRDGTYVQPHYQSAPDHLKSNNWSTEGNTNPYTGEEGRKKDVNSYPNY